MSEVKVDSVRVEGIARAMRNVEISESHARRPFISFQATREKKLMAYLMCSAICHQTHNLRHVEMNLIGWNYLEHVFEKLAVEGSHLLDLKYLVETHDDILRAEFEQLFPESKANTVSALDRIEERVQFIKNIASVILNEGHTSACDYFDRCGGYLYNDGTGLYEVLASMEAFKDPFKKKSTLFIKLMDQSGVVLVKEPEKYEPLMDYHMQRLLLRTGCVKVLDSELEGRLKRRESLESDEVIRRACISAIKGIAEASEVSILDLDDLFWAIGRSCCKEKVLCRDHECSKEPCTFTVVSNVEKHETCLFEGVCKGNMDKGYRIFWEPQVTTSYY